MKRYLTVLVILLVLSAVILSGCRAANQVPGVSAVGSAIASVIPSLPPATQNTAGAMTTMPAASPLPSPTAQ